MLKQYKSAIIIFGVSLLIMLPAFIFGSGGGDLIFHTLWSEHFHQQILAGNLYPRWLHNINSGCGEPVFFFYPPFAFYLNSLVQIVTGNKLDSWYSMSIVLFIAVLVGNVFLYLWVKDITASIKYALSAVVIFTFLPYKSFYIYHTFTYPQTIASVCFLPAALFCINRYHNTRNNIFLLGYIFTQSFIFLTNIPAAIVISGLPVLYYMFTIDQKHWNIDILKLLLSIVLSILLSLFYLLPVYELLPYTHIYNDESDIISGNFDYSTNFIDSHLDLATIMNHRLYVLVIILNAFSIKFFCLALKSNLSKKLRISLYFWFSINIISFIMMLSISSPIWDSIPILKYLQFPSRFSTIQAISLTMTFVLYLISRQNIKESIDKFMWPFLILMSCILIINLAPRWSIKGDIISFGEIENERSLIGLKMLREMFNYNITLFPDYLPIYTNSKLKSVNLSSYQHMHQHCSTKTRLISGDANIRINKWQSRNIELAINSKENSIIHINQFYFPNWQAVNKSGHEYKITPIDYYGTMQMEAPEGKHIIKLTMPPFKSEIIGKYISLSTFFILLSYLIYLKTPNIFRKHNKNSAC